MIIHMKRTTLIIDEHNFRRLKQMAASEGRALSELVDECIRDWLTRRQEKSQSKTRYNLPTFDMGKTAINVADRDQIENILNEIPR